MRQRSIKIIVLAYIIYNIIKFLISKGVLFTEDSHVRLYYIYFFPYYFVLFFVGFFYRYIVATLLSMIPSTLMLWQLYDYIYANYVYRVPVELLLLINLVLLILINEFVFPKVASIISQASASRNDPTP